MITVMIFCTLLRLQYTGSAPRQMRRTPERAVAAPHRTISPHTAPHCTAPRCTGGGAVALGVSGQRVSALLAGGPAGGGGVVAAANEGGAGGTCGERRGRREWWLPRGKRRWRRPVREAALVAGVVVGLTWRWSSAVGRDGITCASICDHSRKSVRA